jgi:ribosomal protein L37AE/L43A
MAPLDEQFEADEHETPAAAASRGGCPKCGSHDVRRARSEGIVATFLQLFGRWPFRCRSCRSRFFRRAAPPDDF